MVREIKDRAKDRAKGRSIMPRVILTRYLYALDEVMHSLLHALLTKTSMDECAFWLGEIYYTGYKEQLWSFIWCVYYDFYAITFPKYEKKITKLYQGWLKEPTIISLLACIQLFYYSSATVDVFYLRMMKANVPTKVYVGRLPGWVKKLNLTKTERNLVRSIHDGNLVNVAYHVRYFRDSPILAYTAMKTYFRTICNLSLNDASLEDLPYKNKYHIVLATICYLLREEKDIRKKIVCLKLDVNKYQQQYMHSNVAVCPLYKTLPQRRVYSISSDIGSFMLARFTLPVMNDGKALTPSTILWDHWEYFAYRAPYWKARFDQYQIIVNHENYEIVFKDVEEEEAFYEKWYYEPDEQKKEVQQCSLIDIHPDNLIAWIELWACSNMGIGRYEKLKSQLSCRQPYLLWYDEILEETAIKNKVANILIKTNIEKNLD